jgi:hypothetical protein
VIVKLGMLGCALCAATPLLAENPPTARLPTTVMPVAYRLDLRQDPAQPRFSGHVEIDVKLSKATRRIYLNGRGLTVSRAELRIGGRTLPATYGEVTAGSLARLDVAADVPAGQATLVIDYDAPFGAGDGLTRLQAGGRWYSFSYFEPIDARSAFPSFDEPGFKTPYTISMTLPGDLVGVANMPEVSRSLAVDGWITHRYAPTPPLPTYLVAFSAGPFAVATGTVPPTAQRMSALPLRVVATGPQADKLAFALKETALIVTLLEDYFGEGFPFPKLDQVGTPMLTGESAMENAGADLYADQLLLLGVHPSVAQQRSFGMVVAHELSHQWFGDLATPAWWDDLWLNESLANWMGYRIGNAWRPDLKIGAGQTAEALEAMDLDALIVGRPIRQHIASGEDARTAFDSITYSKGGQVITQTAAFLGDRPFRDGVRLHLQRHRFGSATSDDFFTALSDAAHDPRITASMRSFVDQQGVPLVTFARAGRGWTVRQSRYTLLGTTAPEQRWVIPLCVRPLAGTRRCVLMDKASMAMPDANAGPFVPNGGGTGYYRFELPDADWMGLIDQLARLPAPEALAVNDSLWASFAAGRASPGMLVRAARKIAGHGDSAAVLDGAVRLEGWYRRGLVAGADLPAYRRLVASLYGIRLAALGSDVRSATYAADESDRRALRAGLVRVMADGARDRQLRARLAEAASRYLAGERSALDDSFLPTALLVYVQDHGLTTARDLLLRTEASDDAVFRAAALAAVGGGAPVISSADVDALVFKPELSPKTRARVAGLLTARPETRLVAEEIVLSKLSAFGDYVPNLIGFGSVGSFDQACTTAEADAIGSALRRNVAKVWGGELTIARVVERIKACSLLQTKRGREIGEAIASPM